RSKICASDRYARPIPKRARTMTGSISDASSQRRHLVDELKAHPPNEAALLLESTPPALACEALIELNPAFAQDILAELPPEQRAAILKAATPEVARQWEKNQGYEPHTIGRLMEPAYAVLKKDM